MKKHKYALRIFAAVTVGILAVTMLHHLYMPCSFEDISQLDGSVRRDNIAFIDVQWRDTRLYTSDPEEVTRISRALLDYLNDFTYQYDQNFDFQAVFPNGLDNSFPQVYLTYRKDEGRSALLDLSPLDGTHVRINYRYYTVLDGPLDPTIFNPLLERPNMDPVISTYFE